jgi:hypothetical protein
MESKTLPIEAFKKLCHSTQCLIQNNEDRIHCLNKENERALRKNYYTKFCDVAFPFDSVYNEFLKTQTNIHTNDNKIQLLTKQRKEKINFLNNYYRENYPNATLSFKAFYNQLISTKKSNNAINIQKDPTIAEIIEI